MFYTSIIKAIQYDGTNEDAIMELGPRFQYVDGVFSFAGFNVVPINIGDYAIVMEAGGERIATEEYFNKWFMKFPHVPAPDTSAPDPEPEPEVKEGDGEETKK